MPDVPVAIGASVKCQTETSLFYSLFDHHHHQHDRATNNRRQRLTRYARFKPNQVASLRVNSLEISWSNKLAGRELISIDIQAATVSDRTRNKTTTQKQRIYANETLLVTELSCRSSSNNSDLQLGKIHLLALINRELGGQAANGRPASKLAPANIIKDPEQPLRDGKTQSATTKREAIGQQQTPQTFFKSPSASSTESSVPASNRGDDDDDNKVGGRQPADESQNSIETDIDRSSDQETSSNFFPSALGNQSSSLLTNSLQIDGRRNLLASGFNNQFNRQQVGSARALPDGLGESIRERLKSSSLLLFTVSSSLVILAYTLCLLVYLKGRRKSPTTTIARSRRSSSSAAAAASLPVQAEQQQQQQTESSQMRISAPYNLQMPEPTRTRLEMMLRTDKRKHPDAAHYHQQPDSCLEPTSGARRSKKRHRSVDAPRAHMDQQMIHSRARNSLESFVGRQAAEANIEEPVVYYAPHPNVDNFSYSTSDFGYGTLQVVRAIRQAAAVARLKLRSSRYEPNLNVIHESDLEHLQQNAAAVNSNYAPVIAAAPFPFAATKHCRFADQEENFSQTGGVACSEIDHLVQDSLKLECSHFIERMRLPSATLFSKPTKEHSHVVGSQTAIGGDQVSRSGILKLVKQQQQPQHQFVDKK